MKRVLWIISLLISFLPVVLSTPKNPFRFLKNIYGKRIVNNNKKKEIMGNVTRMMKYDQGANERAAINILHFQDQQLSWFRLDDGVMGGQSETLHSISKEDGTLDFAGTINTNGGGFCSIRTNFSGFPENATGVRIRYTGDGKTYKLLLSDGTRGFSTPSWQADIVTTKQNKEVTAEIPFDALKASMGPRRAPSNLQFDRSTIKEIGIMLSLKLSDGSPNPVETFGQGTFPFQIQIHSIEPVLV